MAERQRRSRVRRLLGRVLLPGSPGMAFAVSVALVVPTVVVNPLTLAALGLQERGTVARTILAYNVLSVLAAGVLLLLARLDRVPTLRFGHLVLAPLLLEVGVRVALALPGAPVPLLEQPNLFFRASDTRFWVMRAKALREEGIGREVTDPKYGWIASTSPLGIISDRYQSLDDLPEDRRLVLFFGDSFVASTVTEMADRLPQLVEELAPSHAVLNFGTYGYGLDQIVLRLRGEYPRYRHLRPRVLIGLYTRGLHRSLLSFRMRQKPYFTVAESGVLALHEPAYRTGGEFVDAYRFGATSFTAGFVRKTIATLTGRPRLCGADCIELNQLVLADTARFLEREGIDATFVLLHPATDVRSESADGRLLLRILADAGIDSVLDTRPAVAGYIAEHGIDPTDLAVSREDLHLNARGNRVVAGAIARVLER